MNNLKYRYNVAVAKVAEQNEEFFKETEKDKRFFFKMLEKRFLNLTRGFLNLTKGNKRGIF